jgi:hypothetical protein
LAPTDPAVTVSPVDVVVVAALVKLRQAVLASPTIPEKPLRQLPHVFGVDSQLARFKDEQ